MLAWVLSNQRIPAQLPVSALLVYPVMRQMRRRDNIAVW